MSEWAKEQVHERTEMNNSTKYKKMITVLNEWKNDVWVDEWMND